VRYVLGSPLVTDVFHAGRWDYVYRFTPGHGDAQQRRLSVYFEDDKLTKVSGDVVPDYGGGAKKTDLVPTSTSEAAPTVAAPPLSN
jgi:outer membrane protein assembly factor BamE (lipoprotein component of BamABCDE complex)